VPPAKSAAAQAFLEQVGDAPAGVWSAPGRVNLIGEHTDYNGGFVLPFAIDQRTDVAASRRPDGVVRVRSLQKPDDVVAVAVADLRPGERADWSAYALGTVWALRAAGHGIDGLELVIDGGVPVGSGLSSSAALECATALAATELYDIEIPLETIARIAQRAENDYVGVPCGLMDQMAVSVCRAGHALFFDVRDDVREHEPFAPHESELALLVIDTRARHAHSGGEYAQRRRSCEQAAARLGVDCLRDVSIGDLDEALRVLGGDDGDGVLRRRTRHVVTENQRVLSARDLLRARRFDELGATLTASHVSLRDDFEVSCAELDVAVDAALANGALGARMTGGGFGGCAIALVPARDTAAVSSAVEKAFAEADFAAPKIMAPQVSDGVRRIG
jgi:galactokinase